MKLCAKSLNLDLRLMNIHMKKGSGIIFALPPLLSRTSIKLNSPVLIPLMWTQMAAAHRQYTKYLSAY